MRAAQNNLKMQCRLSLLSFSETSRGVCRMHFIIRVLLIEPDAVVESLAGEPWEPAAVQTRRAADEFFSLQVVPTALAITSCC